MLTSRSLSFTAPDCGPDRPALLLADAILGRTFCRWQVGPEQIRDAMMRWRLSRLRLLSPRPFGLM